MDPRESMADRPSSGLQGGVDSPTLGVPTLCVRGWGGSGWEGKPSVRANGARANAMASNAFLMTSSKGWISLIS